MDISECIRKMIEESGMSARQVSRELGRSSTYLSSTLTNRADVGASNVAKIAGLLGWRLVLIKECGKERKEMEVSPRADSD